MRGKRFTTPSRQPAMRQRGYTHLHALSSPTSPGRWATAGRCASKVSPSEPSASHGRLRRHLTVAPALSTTSTPERRRQTVLGSSTQSSVPGASVHHMLNELVDLSHSIAALLEQGQMPLLTPAPSAADREQEAHLKTQEIERIVRRVEAHFVDRIHSLETANASLLEEVRQLREVLATHRTNGGPGLANALHAVHGGLREEAEALGVSDTASSDEVANCAAVSEAEYLRRVLVAERRQRLRVEEQTQSLTEQHARVVEMLERRLRKQEEQLYDLIASIDKRYGGGPSTTSASPRSSIERGSPRLATPRRLLRQQLAQHQQTQRALQQYKENLRFDPSPPAASDEVGTSVKELGLDDVRRTLESIRCSKPPIVQEQNREGQLTQGTAAACPLPQTVHNKSLAAHSPVAFAQALPLAGDRIALTSTSDMDEISMFLENITKELESLDAH
ncbi:hypothetical protein LSCM1_01658 [Leishmania martiniquensis]|uniref:Uncharacterized protein n=1 Tax=Leishmania martiniquensis TaxID=1580590 RepID=A0A836GBP4_9TRYP|nr:hypothetical protein LSCM1_01658 [Leishmania martiniquensis]